MTGPSLYRILDRPALYRLVQGLLAPGAHRELPARLSRLLASLPRAEPVLEVGCGPASWLWTVGLRPVGLDLSPAYSAEFRHAGGRAVAGSAEALPFREAAFAAVWSIGLLHHLDERAARAAIGEMIRVSGPAGYVAIVDAVMPRTSRARPLAWLLRRLDRGRFVRSQKDLVALLPGSPRWTVDRFTYAWTGLEALACCRRGERSGL